MNSKTAKLLLILFLYGCSSFSESTNISPSKISPSHTPTSTATFTLTPTITSTPTLTPTPTPDIISLENGSELVVIKLYDGDNRGPKYFSPNLKNYYSKQGTTKRGEYILTVWDTGSDKELFTIPEPSLTRSAIFSPDSKLLAVWQAGGLSFWEIASGNHIRTMDCDGYRDAAFSMDGNKIFTGVSLCDVTIGQTLHKFKCREAKMDCLVVAISPDGRVAASISDVGRVIGKHEIILWDTETGKEIRRLDGGNIYPSDIRSIPIVSLAFSPDGKTLASIDLLSTIIIWNVLTGEKINVFDPVSRNTGIREQPALPSHSLAFSPDGKILATGYRDGSIILWNVATTQPLVVVPATHSLSGYITSVFFSSDGKTLVTQSDNDNLLGANNTIWWGLAPGQKMFSPHQTPASLQGSFILDVTDTLPETKNYNQAIKSPSYSMKLNMGIYSILLKADSGNNICSLIWQVRPVSEPNSWAFAYGDSNILGSFTIAQPGDYVISIVRARRRHQCPEFSFSLQVAGP